MTKLLVAEIAENAHRDLSVETEILGPTVQISRLAFAGDKQALVTACQKADVILTDFVPLTREILHDLTRCQLISVAATGYSSVDIDAARDARINVCAIDEYCTNEVADHTLALILALSRRLIDYHNIVQRDKRWQFDAFSGLPRLSDLTMGIIGFGRIGQAVAKRAAGFGMTVIAFDTRADNAAAKKLNVTLTDLDTLYASSDIISLHCDTGPSNQAVIDDSALRKMRRRPILINVARGELLNEQALVQALDKGSISAAGLDVLTEEPPDLSSSALLGRDNVVLTPHTAFFSDRSILENRTVSASNVRHHLDGNHTAVRKYVHRVTDASS